MLGKKATRSSNDDRAYLQRLKQRARELYEEDAFATEEDIERALGLEEISTTLAEDRRKRRKRTLVYVAMCLVLVVLSLPIPFTPDFFNEMRIYSPGEVLDAYGLFFQMNVLPLFDSTQANQADAARAAFNEVHDGSLYWQVTMRFALTLLTIGCAWLLSASGMLFQTTFRNPLAAPSMLGVSDGVTLGYIIFLTLGYTSMPDNPPLFFVCAYGFGMVMAVFVLFSSRFIAGSKTYNVMDMLLIGTVVSQIVGGIVTFVINYGFDYSTWLNYYDLLQSVDTAEEPLTYALVAAVILITALPVVGLRFRMNALVLPDGEAHMLGVNPTALRWVALACGGLMQLAALTSLGQVAMVSLAVPFLARYLFPADFRSQLVGNVLISVPLLLICQLVCHFVVVNFQPLNVGTLVAVIIMPVFVWMMALQRKGWS